MDNIEQFVALREGLTKELADLDVEIGRITQLYEIVLPDYIRRRNELFRVLFGEEPVEIVMDEASFEPMSNVEQVMLVVRDYPGASKKDLREVLPHLSENQLKAALGTASKKNLIENRGRAKSQPEWYVVK